MPNTCNNCSVFINLISIHWKHQQQAEQANELLLTKDTIMKFDIQKSKQGTVPYGYSRSEENPRVLVPDTKRLELIDEAFTWLDKNFSFRDVAAWLSSASGVHVSHSSLYKRYRDRLATMPRLARKS